MEENTMFPELQDILNRIQAFNATHPEGRFVYAFLGFKKDPTQKCVECGGDCDCIDESKTSFGAFGYIDEVRALVNDLRDNIEDNREPSEDEDEPDFVNF